MCDTVVALPKSTSEGATLFGKNSDRPPNEPQLIKYVPRQRHDSGSRLKCTYITVDQARSTLGVFLSAPFWMWGAEMGVNERGVAIGNEAVFSNDEVPESGLLGMDLLRLGLERGKTATEALDVMTSLLEKHGQGGSCELGGIMTYHNSYLIADSRAAWVLETSERRWVAERVRDVRSISNGYTIRDKWDRGSSDIIEHAIKQGWCKDDSGFDFAAVYGNEGMRYIARCDDRLSCTTSLLERTAGSIDFLTVAGILRSHPTGWTPWNQEVAAVCQHAGNMNGSVSAGSQISQLGEKPVHWFTGCSHPCMSLYVPFTFVKPYVYMGMSTGGQKFSSDSFWWKRERTSRNLSSKFSSALPGFRSKVQSRQQAVLAMAAAPDQEKTEMMLDDFAREMTDLAGSTPLPSDMSPDYMDYWRERNAEAGV